MAAVSSLKGTFEGEQLFSLLSYFKLTRATGKLELAAQGNRAAVYLQEGKVVHAECPPLTGDKAIAQLSVWKNGHFNFVPNAQSPKSTITDSLEGLALSVAVAIDEGKFEPLPVVPNVNLDLPARLSSRPPVGEIVMGMEEISLLSKINAKSTLREITLELDWTVEQMRIISHKLIKAGALELARATQPDPRASAADPRVSGDVRLRSDTVIDARFVQALREAFARVLGPAAGFLWDDVAREVRVNPDQLPTVKFTDFLRALAGSIDDPNARDHFIKLLTQLRAQHRI